MPASALETSWGELKTHIELFHYSIDNQKGEDSRATVLGGYLKYTSKPLYDFGFTVKHYTSHLLLEGKNPEVTCLTDFAGEDLNPLSELYLYYKNDTFSTKIGRQELNTPLINNDTTRLIPFSYTGITSRYTFREDSYLSLGYITRFRFNNCESYTTMTPSGEAGNGVSFLGFNTRFGEVKHQWYYYHAPGLYDALHLQVESKTSYSQEREILYGVQAVYTFSNGPSENISNHANGGSNVKLLAAKLGLASDDFSYVASLSYNFGEDGINRGYGGLSSLYTTSMITNGKKDGHPFAKSLKVKYKYYTSKEKKEYSSSLYLTNVTYPESDYNTINALYFDHMFKFRPREYIFFRFEKQWIENEPNKMYFRLISAYEF